MNTNTAIPIKNTTNVKRDGVTDEDRLKLKALRRAIRKQKRLAKLQGKKELSSVKKSPSTIKLKGGGSKDPSTVDQKRTLTLGSKRDKEAERNFPSKSTKSKTNSSSQKGNSVHENKETPSEKKKISFCQVNDETKTVSTKSSKSFEEDPSQPIKFPINEECTSIAVAPSGRHIIAGFTDGTLRLFDTTGRLWNKSKSFESNTDTAVDDVENDLEALFDCDSSDSESESSRPSQPTKAKNRVVMSRTHQNYGSVACQIHAKGVITSLLMSVGCCEDGSYAFGGVLRGSTELVAVDLSSLEKYHDNYDTSTGDVCILDLIKVYRYSDAKLKGFGACIRLKNTARPEYRLFTGKGIKVSNRVLNPIPLS